MYINLYIFFSVKSLLEEAKKIGFPIMIKAVMGGGGKVKFLLYYFFGYY
jgi:biotin carboxylase